MKTPLPWSPSLLPRGVLHHVVLLLSITRLFRQNLIQNFVIRETEELEVIKAAEEAALAEAEAATNEAAAVAVAHGIITQEEVDALKR